LEALPVIGEDLGKDAEVPFAQRLRDPSSAMAQ
jgi:hypothetical protein